MRVCHPNVVSYRDLEPQQIYQKPTFPNSNSTRNQVDEEPLRGCATSQSLFIIISMRTRKSVSTQRESSVDIEHGTFTPLVSTTTGGMGKECLKYHSRLARLIAIKKGEQYAKTISWIRTRTSFALLRSALVCLGGSRTRRVPCDIRELKQPRRRRKRERHLKM